MSNGVAYANGELVETCEPDRGERAELEAIMEEAGYGADWLERQVLEHSQGLIASSLKQVLASLICPPPRSSREIELAVICYSIGVPGLPPMSHAGEAFNLRGMSKQAFSIRCKNKIKELSLRPSIYMKSEEASRVYARTNKRKNT